MKGNFQLIILIVFIVAAIVGILVFSGAIPIGKDIEGSLGTVTLWGTMPSQNISPALKDFNDANQTFVVNYVQKSPDTFDQDLLEALASGWDLTCFFCLTVLLSTMLIKFLPFHILVIPLPPLKVFLLERGKCF